MLLVLFFGIALLAAVMLSGIASRSVISIAAIFLLIGFLAGQGVTGLIQITNSTGLFNFVEVALVAILFTDGMKIGKDDLFEVWSLPGRALLLGLPLTLLIVALLTRLILNLTWLESFLVAAVLSPTDPVFTSTILSRQEIPIRLRRLLNVESGINDGIALPIVLTVFALLGVEELKVVQWLGEILLGVGIGIGIPWLIMSFTKVKFFSISGLYAPLLGLATGMLVYSSAKLLQANVFLAAFFAGVTIATIAPDFRELFMEYGELISELFMLGGVLLFGALLTIDVFAEVNPLVYLLTISILFLARPIGISLALAGSSLDWRERLIASWFGPRGFASVVYGMLVWGSGIYRARELFLTISVVVTGSILVHSSTDFLAARWFQSLEQESENRQDLEPPSGEKQGEKTEM